MINQKLSAVNNDSLKRIQEAIANSLNSMSDTDLLKMMKGPLDDYKKKVVSYHPVKIGGN